MAVATVLAFGGLRAVPARWPWRTLIFLPAAAAALGFLQLLRGTCVVRAAEGTFERDDGSTVAASESDARASRAVARTVLRDAVLVGLAVAALAVAAGRP
jgi:hypothetical protein